MRIVERFTMNVTETAPALLSAAPIRNEPVQARSTARLATLLDSAAAVIDEIGYERLTTAMVAERAGASIGTVYRYFPDRIAVLQALGARNTERLLAEIAPALVADRHGSAAEVMLGVLDAMIGLFRSEPGYRSIRVGDVIDLLPPATDVTAHAAVADVIADAVIAGYGVVDSAESRRVVGTALEVADALVARAFARAPQGDAALLDEARRAVSAVVAGRL